MGQSKHHNGYLKYLLRIEQYATTTHKKFWDSVKAALKEKFILQMIIPEKEKV